MKKRRVIALLLALFLVVGLAACGGDDEDTTDDGDEAVDEATEAPADDDGEEDDTAAEPVSGDIEEKTFTLANASSEDTVTVIFSEKFAELVSEYSGGAMTVEVYNNSQLGGDAEIFTNLGVGQIDFVVGNTAPQVATIPSLAIFDLPNAFASAQIGRAVFEDDEFMDLIRADYEAAGYKLLGYADQYYRVMSSNVNIESIDDFNGVKIRTMENEYHLAYWQALGANPIPQAFSEVYVSLQQGTIDAQENPHEVIVSSAFYEVQDYVINTNHLLHIISLVTNDAMFESLSDAQQQVILDAAAEAIPWARAQADERVEDRIETIEGSGTEIVDISDELRDEILDKVSGVYDDIRDAVGEDLYTAFMDAIDRAS